MSEFLGNYGFFILIALMMLVCHLGHAGHGGHQRRKDGAEDPDAQSGNHRR